MKYLYLLILLIFCYSCTFVTKAALSESRNTQMLPLFEKLSWLVGDWELVNGKSTAKTKLIWEQTHELRYDGSFIYDNPGSKPDIAKVHIMTKDFNNGFEVFHKLIKMKMKNFEFFVKISENSQSFICTDKRNDSTYVFKYALIRDTLHIYKNADERLLLYKYVKN